MNKDFFAFGIEDEFVRIFHEFYFFGYGRNAFSVI